MKIYYSNLGTANLEGMGIPPIGILVSYYGLKSLKRASYCDKLFLDSGAFSAWKKGISLPLSDYIEYLKKNKSKVDVYCSLDDIGDFEISVSNYKAMLKAGLDPLPCFHYGEPMDILKSYLDCTDYVGLGGIALKATTERLLWLDRIFDKYSDRKFHGFGINEREILRRYPWHSVDASSVHVLARFGGVCTPWGDYKINPDVNPGEIRWRTDMNVSKMRQYISNLGVDFEAAQKGDTPGTHLRCKISILYYENLVKEIKSQPRKSSGITGFDFD